METVAKTKKDITTGAKPILTGQRVVRDNPFWHFGPWRTDEKSICGVLNAFVIDEGEGDRYGIVNLSGFNKGWNTFGGANVGLVNDVRNDLTGANGALLNRAEGRLTGISIALVNIAETINGVAGAFVNMAPVIKGFAAGAWNACTDAFGVLIGIENTIEGAIKGIAFGLFSTEAANATGAVISLGMRIGQKVPTDTADDKIVGEAVGLFAGAIAALGEKVKGVVISALLASVERAAGIVIAPINIIAEELRGFAAGVLVGVGDLKGFAAGVLVGVGDLKGFAASGLVLGMGILNGFGFAPITVLGDSENSRGVLIGILHINLDANVKWYNRVRLFIAVHTGKPKTSQQEPQ